MGALEDRLRERFEAGLVTDVRAPDAGTRLTVLRKRAQQDELDVDADALERIADARRLQPARARGRADPRRRLRLADRARPVTAELADEVLAGLYPELKPPRARTPSARSRRRPATAFGVSLEQLLSTSRAAPVAWPRQVAMYLARELTDQTLPAIGRAFGGPQPHHRPARLPPHRRADGAATREAYETVRRLTERSATRE